MEVRWPGTSARSSTRLPLVWVASAAGLGILADRQLDGPLIAQLLLGGLAALVGLALARRGAAAATLCVLLAIAATFSSWHHVRWNLFRADEVGLQTTDRNQPIRVRGVVCSHLSQVMARPTGLSTIPPSEETRFRLRFTEVADGFRWRPASGLCAVTVQSWGMGLRPGDQISVVGQIRRPRMESSPGGRSPFAMARSRRQLSRLVATHAECVDVIHSSAAWDARWWLARYRMRCASRLFDYLGRERGELAAALLLGCREYLDHERVDAFFLTGTVHLLAISGLHVGILAYALFVVARLALVPRRTALWGIMVLCVLYAALTGGRAPVMRASVLVLTICAQMLLYRRPVSLNTLALAALVVLTWNPTQVFLPGAQLSFLAVGALAFAARLPARLPEADPIERLKQRNYTWWESLGAELWSQVKTVALASLVIWSVTLPLVMYRFHVVTPAAVLLNLVLWVPVAVALLLGFGVILLGGWLAPVAEACAAVCTLCLGGMEGLVSWARTWEGSHFWTAGPSLLAVSCFYAALVAVVAIPKLRCRRGVCFAVISTALVIQMAVADRMASRPDSLRCSFLALGYGTSVVLELPTGEVWLYDAGCLGSPTTSVEEIASFLWSRQITKLDGIVISHADADHYNAVPGILRRFAVDVVCISPSMLAGWSQLPAEFRAAVAATDCRLRTLEIGTSMQPAPGVGFTVLHPRPAVVHENDNANSIVLLVEYDGHRLLLPGDLERDGMLELLDTAPFDCDVVLAPHHGSQYSLPEEFCQWCQPEYVVISGGQINRATEIKSRFQAVPAQVLHTAVDGLVEASISDDRLLVSAWKAKAGRSSRSIP